MAIVVLEHSDLSRSARLGRVLRDHGHRLDVRQLHRGDPVPADLDGVDGVVTCGGPGTAQDDSIPWLSPEMDFLESAHRADLPIVAICLGSQILARALDGEVETGAGLEFGWHPVTLTGAGKNNVVHAGVGWTTMQFHYHRAHVTRLPPGAALLSGSAACETQAWCVGQRVYAFQYHPECDPAGIEAWADDAPEILEEAGVSREELRTQTEEHAAAMARIAARMFEHIALLVMPVDRRVAGLVKELHH